MSTDTTVHPDPWAATVERAAARMGRIDDLDRLAADYGCSVSPYLDPARTNPTARDAETATALTVVYLARHAAIAATAAIPATTALPEGRTS